jgi:hypothetical protein
MICPYLSNVIKNELLSENLNFNLNSQTYPDISINISSLTPELSGVYMLYHDCIGENCQLWDSYNEECSLKSSKNTLDNMNNTLDNMNNTLDNMDTIMNHVHDSHEHKKDHNCENLDAGCGEATIKKKLSVPYANTLISEYLGSQDLDGNGYIYGIDFGIVDSPDKPSMLDAVEYNEGWVDPSIMVNWSDLKQWSITKDESDNPLA